MATYSGRKARITVNASTTEALITEMGNWSVNRSAEEVDASAFGDGWGKSDVGMKKWSGSISGHYDPADADGQKVLEDAYDSGELISDIRFYIQYSETSGDTIRYLAPDTASDPKAGLRVTGFDSNVDKSGVAQLSVTFSGSGPVKTFEAVVA